MRSDQFSEPVVCSHICEIPLLHDDLELFRGDRSAKPPSFAKTIFGPIHQRQRAAAVVPGNQVILRKSLQDVERGLEQLRRLFWSLMTLIQQRTDQVVHCIDIVKNRPRGLVAYSESARSNQPLPSPSSQLAPRSVRHRAKPAIRGMFSGADSKRLLVQSDRFVEPLDSFIIFGDHCPTLEHMHQRFLCIVSIVH